MSESQCNQCEYLSVCFWGLKFMQRYVSKEQCKQYRKKREAQQKLVV